MTLGFLLPVLPVLLPFATAVLLLVMGDHHVRRARTVSIASAAVGLALAIVLATDAAHGIVHMARMGDWSAPFGIVLVIDRLSALMLVLTQSIALAVLLHASQGADARGRHFHALLHFQLMGLAGAFVTGDLFNLFVFFEVLLIASYALMAHGGGRARLRHGVTYVVLNLVASALFLVGVAVVYAVTGTLNLAHLAQRVQEIAPADAALLGSGSLLLLVVFGFKAALAPLHLWLPATYAAASAPVAALFAIMTKVGVYAILRVHGAVFGADSAMTQLLEPWLLPLALATGVLGVLGAVAASTLPRLVAWLNVASVGTVLTAVGLYTAAGWSAAIYYLLQSALVVAALFLLADLIGAQRGDAGGALEPGPPVDQPALLGTMLLVGAAAVAGLPPLPGFLGKVMILQAAQEPAAGWVWSILLGVGLLSLLSMARAGSVLFWATQPDTAAGPARTAPGALAPTLALMALVVAVAMGASPLKRYADAAARQIVEREAYARAVLGHGAPAHPMPATEAGRTR